MFSNLKLDEKLLNKIEDVFNGYKIKFIVNTSDQITIRVNSAFLTFLYYPFKPILKLVKFENIKILSVKEIGAVKAYPNRNQKN